MNDFEANNRAHIAQMGQDPTLAAQTQSWFESSLQHEYSYHFTWMGLPVIQYPQDLVAMQELIWEVKPDLIIETCVARGGSLIFYASMLELIGGEGRVVGVDIDIRPHNRAAIEAHPMMKRIELIQGSSVDPGIVETVRGRAKGCKRVLVALDSNHTHAHVLAELEAYAPLVTRDSYLVAFDTCIERTPDALIVDRPWRRGDNPWTALQAYLKTTDRFRIASEIVDKLQITVAPDGYLKCVK